MTNWRPYHEAQLAARLRKTLADYVRAMRVLDEIESALQTGAEASVALQRLRDVSDEIADREADPVFRELKELWRRHRPSPAAGEVAELLREHQSVLEQLIPRVQAAQAAALEQRDQLSPQLDVQRRTQQVVSAYAAAVKNA